MVECESKFQEGTSQKSINFWCHVSDLFIKSRVPTLELHPRQSLELKWSTVQHFVSKFVGAFVSVCDLYESDTNEEDRIAKHQTTSPSIIKRQSPIFCFPMECCQVLQWRLTGKRIVHLLHRPTSNKILNCRGLVTIIVQGHKFRCYITTHSIVSTSCKQQAKKMVTIKTKLVHLDADLGKPLQPWQR